MPGIGPWELVIILLIVVVIFGAGRLSQVGGALGKSIKEFRQATHEDEQHPAVPASTTATVVAAPSMAAASVICAKCGGTNAAGQKFCSQCGNSLAAPVASATPAPVAAAAGATSGAPVETEIICPSCATHNPAGQPFCGQCGTRLTTRAA